MTQEEYDKAPKIEQILYDKTGMLAENHADIIEAMTEYAESEVKKLNIFIVSLCNVQQFFDHYGESKHKFYDKVIDVLKTYKG